MELPLTHPEYYEEMGIKPPKGVRFTFVYIFEYVPYPFLQR